MSMMKSGRCGRASIASATLPGVRIKCDAPVEVTTMSERFIASTRPGKFDCRAYAERIDDLARLRLRTVRHE